MYSRAKDGSYSSTVNIFFVFLFRAVTTCDYSTRQARTPPASFFVAVLHFLTCRAQLTNATAAGRSGNSTESPGTISRCSGVMRFVTVLRGGGGMFFVIIGRSYSALLFPCQSAKSFSLLARFVFPAIGMPRMGTIVFLAEIILFLFCCVSSARLYSPPRSAVHSAPLAQLKIQPIPTK
jgi:hypothetical protein